MSFIAIVGIAVALGMDAFAVAVASGVKLCRVTPAQIVRMAGAFGGFQFLMPILGWLAGSALVDRIQGFDHWVAFALLAAVGVHMIAEGWRPHDPKESSDRDPTRGVRLLVLAVATSIDALAVGLTFSLLGTGVWGPAAIIGIVAALMTAVGMKVGCRLGLAFGHRMEILGGVILLVIGLKIVFDHIL